MIDIEELKRLALAATPGPWNFSRESWNVSTPDCDLDICVYRPTLDDGETDDPSNLTGEFIAAANPQTVLALIQRLELAEHWSKVHSESAIKRSEEADNAQSELAALRQELEEARKDAEPLTSTKPKHKGMMHNIAYVSDQKLIFIAHENAPPLYITDDCAEYLGPICLPKEPVSNIYNPSHDGRWVIAWRDTGGMMKCCIVERENDIVTRTTGVEMLPDSDSAKPMQVKSNIDAARNQTS